MSKDFEEELRKAREEAERQRQQKEQSQIEQQRFAAQSAEQWTLQKERVKKLRSSAEFDLLEHAHARELLDEVNRQVYNGQGFIKRVDVVDQRLQDSDGNVHWATYHDVIYSARGFVLTKENTKPTSNRGLFEGPGESAFIGIVRYFDKPSVIVGYDNNPVCSRNEEITSIRQVNGTLVGNFDTRTDITASPYGYHVSGPAEQHLQYLASSSDFIVDPNSSHNISLTENTIKSGLILLSQGRLDRFTRQAYS